MSKRLGKYRLGGVIGTGSFGVVFKAVDTVAEVPCAIKMLKKEVLKKARLLTQLDREIGILKVLRHPNVIQLYDLLESTNHYYMVMELVEGGDLCKRVYSSKNKSLSETESQRYFWQMISAIDYFHGKDVAHRDLKPQNILIDYTTDTIKIADFGLATKQKGGEGAVLRTACGSPQFVAPEIINVDGDMYDGHVADIWSCGVILYYMLAGKVPFEDSNRPNLFVKIRSGQIQSIPDVSSEASDLINCLLQVDPACRITMANIFKHPWLKTQLESWSTAPKGEDFESVTEAITVKEAASPTSPMGGSPPFDEASATS